MNIFGPDPARVILEPWAWLLVILVSVLGLLGNLGLYQLGKQGLEAVVTRFPRIKPDRWNHAGELLEARGSWILLATCLPGLGLLLSTAAGAFGISLVAFLLWIMVAKMVRNWLLLIIVANLYHLVAG
jgi:membrane protein YqaA with SNARE-associated domain